MSAAAGGAAWPELLERLVGGEDLDEETAAAAMGALMDGTATSAQVGAFLAALRSKGETVAELTGLARTMRAFSLHVEVSGPVVDTCGTGGDGAGTFNVSTVAALVAAGAGAHVAKHGNRAASGRCGSADLLESWGVVIDLPPEHVAACLQEVGIGFCFAPVFHPAMRNVIGPRRELGIRTVFNILGPLTNPADADHQTIGVADGATARRMAGVLARLGTRHALVFHGDDGLDELTTTARSTLWEVRAGEIDERTFDPVALGLARVRPEDLRGGDIAENRRIAEAVFEGRPGPAREIVLLGAAAALVALDAVGDWAEGLGLAERAIDSGAAGGLLERWIKRSQSLGETSSQG